MIFSLGSFANESISLKFSRTGTAASDVKVSILDVAGNTISGATATLSSNLELRGTAGAINESIICPNANANTNPEIEMTLNIVGLGEKFKFNAIGLDIHALNGASNYQELADGVTRQWNVSAEVNSASFGSLNDIDIAAGIGSVGNVHKVWGIVGNSIETEGSVTLKLAITKGTTNSGCFFGLSEIKLYNSTETPEPEIPEGPQLPGIDTSDGKIYNISWKNTGGNYITEGDDNNLYVDSYDVTKRQFWQFIPTDKANCFYIRNTATGRYMKSCNLAPSSASKIYTGIEPVEYYVGNTTATSGENEYCKWLSSTDCANYDKENSSPRALNKDGASNNVITWTAGTTNVGSYWKLIETEDLYEIRVFEPSSNIGTYEYSYNIESYSGTNITLANNGVVLASPDMFDNNQEWYFVGTNNKNGWQILSCTELTTAIGIENGKITAKEGVSTKWKVNESTISKEYIYFTCGETTLKIDGDSLFKFNRLRSKLARNLQIYNNPCGVTKENYATKISVSNCSDELLYESTSKPTSWHVVYSKDKANIAMGSEVTIGVTLSQNAASDVKVHAYFDWNRDGIFETSKELNISGKECTVSTTVPSWSLNGESRMRVRINQSGLDLAEDDVEGFVYDLKVIVSGAQTSVDVIEQEEELTITQEGSRIYATANKEVTSLSLYTTTAQLVGKTQGNSIDISSLDSGIYIVKVTTAGNSISAKVYIRK